MKYVLISTHLLAAGLGLGLGAAFVDTDAQRRAFEAGAIAGVQITRLDNGLLKQGVTLSNDEIKKLINNEWLKFK